MRLLLEGEYRYPTPYHILIPAESLIYPPHLSLQYNNGRHNPDLSETVSGRHFLHSKISESDHRHKQPVQATVLR